ncbi:VWA domain-containing protein [Novosphingobium sp.]|uniref:VWA domain-containing protein n=1 Tax=Novosphingobium sp. TaxID=1874826 RepID=UPI0025F50F7D|nr:VWA domain-containing protein [Novosphingobium sp.]MCC6926098.1 VWA domain-containing protein [Novosphingobium sp.]
MRQGISVAAIIAMLAQGPAMAVPPERAAQQGRQGLCYKPAPLPQLGAESWNQQRPRRPHPVPVAKSSRSAERVTATAPTPPVAVDGEAPIAEPAIAGDAPAVSAEAEFREAVDSSPAPPAKVMPGEIAGRPDRMPPRPHPYPRAGLLTAGEHDDLLNPELYSAYLRRSNLGQELPVLPRLDTARVLTVAVKDDAGRPVPFAPVELACADGGRLRLATTADGTVSFFPELDRLGQKVWLRAGRQDWREVALASGSGGQQVQFTLGGAAPKVNKLDLMLVIDTTGSMSDEISYLQAELGKILADLRRSHPGLDVRVGFVFYRDLGDDYVTNTIPLTRDFTQAQNDLAQRYAGGGGDYPEAMDQALIRAAGQDWRGDAVKTMLLVADAPPHDDKMGLAWQASETLRHNRVQIVPVAASGVADKAEYVMRAMAALTQSRYTFLTDDSGIGNAHAAPAIDCYLVTRLSDLLRRVIDSQISGRRIEPDDQEVIRTVGKYDHGRCIIPPGGLQDQ